MCRLEEQKTRNPSSCQLKSILSIRVRVLVVPWGYGTCTAVLSFCFNQFGIDSETVWEHRNMITFDWWQREVDGSGIQGERSREKRVKLTNSLSLSSFFFLAADRSQRVRRLYQGATLLWRQPNFGPHRLHLREIERSMGGFAGYVECKGICSLLQFLCGNMHAVSGERRRDRKRECDVLSWVASWRLCSHVRTHSAFPVATCLPFLSWFMK